MTRVCDARIQRPSPSAPRRRGGSGASWALLVALLPGAARAQEREEPPPALPAEVAEAFARLADPRADDWPSEVQAAEAQALLERLAAALVASDEEALAGLVSRARGSEPRPEGAELARSGAIELRRHAPELYPAGAERALGGAAFLARLFEPLAPAAQRRVSFVVEGVTPLETGSYSTRVRLRARGRVGEAALQLDGFLRVGFAPGEAGAARIETLDVEALDELRAARPLFREATAAVLEGAGGRAELLAHGAEHWRSRVDDLGEPNFWAHNGIAVGDVNGDDLPDLYVAMGTGVPNLLLVQQPDGTVRERAFEAGCAWLDDTKGVLLADMDGDGDQDLLCAIGPTIVLSTNDGEGNFTPARSLRAATDAAFYGLAAADYDADGDLDLYGVRYVKASYGESVPVPYHDARNGPRNHLLRNEGAEGFRDVTDELGLGENNDRFSLAPCWADVDGDGDQDLYVANDFGGNNLYRNDGGRFVDVAAELGVLDLAAGMGTSFADLELDGDLDLLVSNMYTPAGLRVGAQPRFFERAPELAAIVRGHAMGNALYRRLEDGRYEEVGGRAGVRDGGWSWGALFTELDGDGLPDMVVPNGFLSGPRTDDLESYFWRQVASRSPAPGEDEREYVAAWAATTRLMDAGWSWSGHQRSRAFLALGDARYVDASYASGLDFLGDARALARCDWDGDGDLDLVLKSRTAPALRILLNEAPFEGRAVALRLVGTNGNSDAIGARVELSARAGERARRFVTERRAGEGYLAQSGPFLVFALAPDERVESLRVRWPGGDWEAIAGVEPGGRYRVVQGSGEARALPPRAVTLGEGGALEPAPEAGARVVLRTRLPLPPRLRRALFAEVPEGRPRLVVLFDDGERSLAALGALAERSGALAGAGLAILPVAVGAGAERERARAAFAREVAPRMAGDPFAPAGADAGVLRLLELLAADVVHRWSPAQAPTALLVDAQDTVALLQVGGLEVERLLADLPGYGLDPASVGPRGSWPGIWFFGMPRDWPGLAGELRAAGLEADARFYELVARYQDRPR